MNSTGKTQDHSFVFLKKKNSQKHKMRESWKTGKLPAELYCFSGALVVWPRCEPPLEGNLRRGEAAVVAGGALVLRSLGTSGRRAAGRSELFLRAFS